KAHTTLYRVEPITKTEQYTELEDIIALLETDKNYESVLKVIKYYVYSFGTKLLASPKEDAGPNPYKLKESILKFVESYPSKESDQLVKLFLEVVKKLSKTDRKLAVETFKEFGDLYKKSKYVDDRVYGEELIGTSRRLGLPENQMFFSGTTPDGKKVVSTEIKNKVILVEFWATWCPNCVKQFPSLREHYEKYNKSGFEIVAISTDTDKAALQKFLDKEKLPWTVFQDRQISELDDQKHSDYYGVKVPNSVLIGRDGNVIATDLEPSQLNKELSKLFPAVK
ncbi:MAG: peroxiredoxin family protein, partial [Thermoguttaceae bacterium]